MDFVEVVKKRRMVRNFSDQPLDDDTLNHLLDLARRGPSAGFTQGQAFVAVTDEAIRHKIAELCGEKHYVGMGFDHWLSKAPVLVIPCTSESAYHKRYQESDKVDDDGQEINWPVPYWFMDIGCGVMTLLLAAVNEGLAAGFAGTQHTQKLKDLLGIPEEFHPVGVIPIGHPAEDKKSPSLKRGRKSTMDVIHHNGWKSSSD